MEASFADWLAKNNEDPQLAAPQPDEATDNEKLYEAAGKAVQFDLRSKVGSW